MPAELQAISDRFGRLYERLNGRDPDLEPDEIPGGYRYGRTNATGYAANCKQSAKMIAMLPKATGA